MKRAPLPPHVFVGQGGPAAHPMFDTPLEADERFECAFPREDGTVGRDRWLAGAEHARSTVGWQVRRVRLIEGRVVGGYEDDRRRAMPVQADLFADLFTPPGHPTK